MDLSIVIVSWNTKELLERCLETVRGNLGRLDAEVFVVDNASEDGSPEMVRERFPEVRLLANTKNLGFAAANNQALDLARGRHVLLLNSDTEVLGDVLERSVDYLDRNPDVGLMGCRVLNPDGSLQPTCFRYPSKLNLLLLTSGLSRLPWPKWLGRYSYRGWRRDSERDVDVVTGCYMLARAEAVRQVGRLDESFFFCGEETDWCLRFRRAGWRVRFAPVGEIIHVGNASGRRLDFRRDLLLTAGLVRLHRKHRGVLGAFAVWSLLLTFNTTRYLGWRTLALFSRGGPAGRRRDHFRGIVREYRNTWPA